MGPGFGDFAVESEYVSGRRRRRAAATPRASRWRGIVATRDALDLTDPEVAAAMPRVSGEPARGVPLRGRQEAVDVDLVDRLTTERDGGGP